MEGTVALKHALVARSVLEHATVRRTDNMINAASAGPSTGSGAVIIGLSTPPVRRVRLTGVAVATERIWVFW